MSPDELTPEVIDRLLSARVANVTITGGEPFMHYRLVEIVECFTSREVDVTICTNGVSITPHQIDELVRLRRVRVNVSLDGYSSDSHGRFRGDRRSFAATLENTRRLAVAGLLKGILSTPNSLARPGEYEELYTLARELGLDYLLMNPLSSFGRGFFARSRLAANGRKMERIQDEIKGFQRSASDPEAVFIRFPNHDRPLTSCIAGEVFYVFVNGDTAICPYLVFASRTPGARHAAEEFFVGNLFENADLARRLDRYDFHSRYTVGANETCSRCSMRSSCGTGCPAAVIARGGRIGELDTEVCPVIGKLDGAMCS